MKSYLVIGLGQFGRHLVARLVEMGGEVMAVDVQEDRVSRVAEIATAVCVGDCQDEQMLAALGVANYDVCFVCVRDDFQASLVATATLKELGAKCVVARADREKQIKFLKKIGADYVVHTELDTAVRTAIRFSSQNVFDYFELTPKYAIVEITTPGSWVGKTIAEVDVRNRYNVNILGIRMGDEIEPVLNPHYRFSKDIHLLVAGDKEAGTRLMEELD